MRPALYIDTSLITEQSGWLSSSRRFDSLWLKDTIMTCARSQASK